MEDQMQKLFDLTFHGQDYLIRVDSKVEELSIEIEQKNTGDVWKNIFQAHYIEQITSKTGNTKKFPVFLKMLMSALNMNSDSVFIDILSYQDLEMLKSRKNQKQKSMMQNQSSQVNISQLQNNNKRYVILTYCAEFDKVHYPLPLNFDDCPDVDQLKGTIRRLRIELDELKNGKGIDLNTSQLIQMKQENDIYKQRIKKLEEINSQLSNQQHSYSHENDTEVQNMRDLLNAKEKEMVEIKNQNLKLKNEIANQSQDSSLQEQLKMTKSKFNEMESIIQQLVQELEDQKQLNQKQQTKIISLEEELEGALQKKSRLNTSNLKSSRLNDLSSSKRSNSQPIKRSPMKFNRQNSPSVQRKNNLLSNNSGVYSSVNSSIISQKQKNTTPRKISQSSTYKKTSVMDKQTESSRGKMNPTAVHNRSPSPMRKLSNGAKYKIPESPSRNFQQKATIKQSPGRFRQQSPLSSRRDGSQQQLSQQQKLQSTVQSSPMNRNSQLGLKRTFGKNSDKKVVSSFKNSAKKNQTNENDSDEDDRLMKKLERLRQKNKENNNQLNQSTNNSKIIEGKGSSQKQDQVNLNTNKVNNFNNTNIQNRINQNNNQNDKSFDVSDIDTRLNNLSDLLRMARK